MQQSTVKDILNGKLEGKDILIKGWIVTKRSSGGVQFLMIRDGTDIIQSTIHKDKVSEKVFDDAEKLTQESSVEVKGKVLREERAPGGYELGIKDLQIIHQAEEYPLAKKEHGVEFLMDHRHLWIRSPKQRAILKIRSQVMKACRDYFDNRDYILIDSPVFTPSACEETSTLFDTKYFGKKAYLTQSGQLYVEAAIAAFGKVYCLGPTFRAEKSRTKRHLTEFWQIEPEMAFMGLDDCMKVQEELVGYVIESVLERCEKELETLKRNVTLLEKAKPPFPRLSYTEAVEMLKKGGLEITWGEDFGAPHEKFLSKMFDKPVIVHRYPAHAKAFYMRPDPENPKVVLCNDMLAPEGYGEIIGGSERIWSLRVLEQKIEEFNLPKEAYEWYMDLRRYGSVPHSGFGLGIERVVVWICKLKHIREAIPFPRTTRRLYP